MPEIAWGKVVGSQFKNKVVGICGRLGCDPSHLTSSMAFETGETFAPDKVNKVSGATGLIQFMPAVARALGTTTADLAAMTAIDQLDYVERYFRPYKGKMSTISDVYMAILWPKAVGKPDSTVLFRSPSKAYQQNKDLTRITTVKSPKAKQPPRSCRSSRGASTRAAAASVKQVVLR
jgi:hypothetical protein